MVRNSYDMISLNSAIDALDSKISGKLQLELYATIEDLLLDRIVWFVRNVDVSKGLADVVEHYRGGIEASRGRARSRAARGGREGARGARHGTDECRRAGRSGAQNREPAARSPQRPTSCSVADRTGKPVQDVAATYFAAGAFFQLDRIANAARGIQVTDYFDRLALDRALDSIGEAERRLTAEMVGNGATGAAGGRCVGRAARRRSRAHPRRRARHRELGADALEAVGGGEPAGGSGEAVRLSRHWPASRGGQLNAGNAARR